jgi:GNAT superfamily N-acetyltransferase
MIETLTRDDLGEVVDVLAEAFHDYPVMRYVLSDSEEYDADVRTLIGFFATSRMHRDEVVLGDRSVGALRGVALVSYPGRRESPPELADLREATWARLGAPARARYETFGDAAGAIDIAVPHLHLNMLGVRDAARGTGAGRRLLEAVHALSVADPDSEGVSLSTEDPANVDLYLHFGYHVVGQADVDGALTTWVFFRPDRDD